jgi:hypothetical protein
MNIREKVFEIISAERDYQDDFWSEFDDSEWHPADWLNFIKRYIRHAEEGTYGAKDLNDYKRHQMEQIRKIGALAVAAMEYNETPERE